MKLITYSARKTLKTTRIEHQDHNFMGNCVESNKLHSLVGDKKYDDEQRTEIMKSERCERNFARNLTFCDKKIKSYSCEKQSSSLKHNQKETGKNSTLKFVCLDLLKLKSMNLHNKFVSFCCYNNSNKTSAAASTSLKIRESKSDSNNMKKRRRSGRSTERRSSFVAVIMQLCLFLLSCLSIVSYVESFQSNCPTICTCKWKNGKNKCTIS